MKTFLTSMSVNDTEPVSRLIGGERVYTLTDTYAGPDIKANSWKEAQKIVDEEYDGQYIINGVKV